MASYTVTAFRWSGTHYNATYTSSYTAEFRDDDGAFEGGGDRGETVSINDGSAQATLGAPYTIRASFRDVDGDQHSEEFHFFNAGGAWYFAPSPESAFTEGATLGSYQGHTVGWDYEAVTCFAAGTLISTPDGARRVETLRPGDRVLDSDGAAPRLRLNMSRRLDARALFMGPTLRPVRILADALGDGMPRRDLLVSRQHRMLVRSPIVHRMFDRDEVLVSAIRLTGMPGIFVDGTVTDLTYHHLVFDDHTIVLAEGCPSESFYPGKDALLALCPRARAEFETLFPAPRLPAMRRAARLIPPNAAQKRLIQRHRRNAKPLLG